MPQAYMEAEDPHEWRGAHALAGPIRFLRDVRNAKRWLGQNDPVAPLRPSLRSQLPLGQHRLHARASRALVPYLGQLEPAEYTFTERLWWGPGPRHAAPEQSHSRFTEPDDR